MARAHATGRQPIIYAIAHTLSAGAAPFQGGIWKIHVGESSLRRLCSAHNENHLIVVQRMLL